MKRTPEQAFTEILKKYDIDTLYFEKDSEPYARARDAEIHNLLQAQDVNIVSSWGHTLTNLDQLNLQYKSIPKMYRGFLKGMSTSLIPKCAARPSSMPKCPEVSGLAHLHAGVPDITEIGFPEIPEPTPYRGGETEALKRLSAKMKQKKWVAEFEKPKTNPASLEPSTTVLSPYLCHGCLSARKFYHEVQSVYKKSKSHSTPPASLHGQLYFREWFYLLSYTVENFDKM